MTSANMVDKNDTTGTITIPELTADIANSFDPALHTGSRKSSGSISWPYTSSAVAFATEWDPLEYNHFVWSQYAEHRDHLEQAQIIPYRISTDIPVDLQVKRLMARIRCSESKRLDAFLNNNTYLLPIVDEALIQLRKYFPEEEMCLSIQDDPDSYNTENLICFVVTKQTVETAELAYDKFRNEWWLDAKGLAGDCFTICVEYE